MASIFNNELDIVWPKLTPDAVITADDVHNSDVFTKMVESLDVDHGYVAPNVGYLVKRRVV